MNRNRKIRQYLAEMYSEGTVGTYIFDIETFLKLHPQAATYNYQEVTAYIQQFVKKYTSKATQNRILSALKAYYEYLRVEGFRNDNPIANFYFESRGRKQQQPQDFLTHDELLALFIARPEKDKKFELRNKVMMSLLVFSGLTSNELVNLTPMNIDLKANEIHIQKSRRINGRTLKLNKVQMDLLNEYMEVMEPVFAKHAKPKMFITVREEWIITGTVRSYLRGLKYVVPGKKIDSKKIRQSVIYNWLNHDGLKLSEVQDMSGQKYPSTTQIYKNVDMDEMKEQIKKYHPLR
jgi:integrase/recombinase XerD